MQCGKARQTKGQAFFIKCMQTCYTPCKDACKDKADSKNYARRNASAALAGADLAHSQRNGGGPQPNEMRPQPDDDYNYAGGSQGSSAPQRFANGAGPAAPVLGKGAVSDAAKESNAAEPEKKAELTPLKK